MLFEAGLCVHIFPAYTISVGCLALLLFETLFSCYLSCVHHAVILTRNIYYLYSVVVWVVTLCYGLVHRYS